MTRFRRLWPVAAVGVLALAGVAGWRWWPRPSPPVGGPPAAPSDPRLTFATPYRNVRPDVKYVGTDACAACHVEHAKTYRQHPMGQSLAPVARATPVERYDAAAKNPFDRLGFQYRVERRGDTVIHREAAGTIHAEVEVQYAVGSGARGRSYLIDHDGFLFQSPITWYPQKKAWDLSPGFDKLHHHFGRPVQADCLFCHSNRVLDVADTQNQYREPIFEGHAIGCERCHGPGELHVKRHESGERVSGADDTIVNPRRLEPALREAICEQCHLQGVARVPRRGRQAAEFRPGLPLNLFLAIFVKPPAAADSQKFVGQVEQMHASRCFTASNGKMGCVSCHDPHVYPAAAEKVTYYRDRCLRCHGEAACSVPPAVRRQTSKDDSCIQCHMPAGESDIQHHSITDHRVPRRLGEASPPGPKPTDDEMPIRLFHRDLLSADDPDAGRDLGVALMDRVERYPPPTRLRLGQLALPRLQAAVQTDPTDVDAVDAKGHAHWAVGELSAAATTFDDVLARSPRREITLLVAATLAMERGRWDAAIPYWERAIVVNPWRHEFRLGLAQAHAQRGNWPAAFTACQDALRLNPVGWQARKLLVECHLATGQTAEARAEFARLLALHPPNEESLHRWFAQRAP
jgi:hypothetical protein